ncbi:MAG: AmmeMemoRadiSam system protein B [bacterium]|nr:AmmeMemoRadiSam system protein B [bacterium]
MKKSVVILILFCFLFSLQAEEKYRGEEKHQSEEIRSVIDTIGYPWQKIHLSKIVSYLHKGADPQHRRQPSSRGLNDGRQAPKVEKKTVKKQVPVAGIAPHDDYLYSARVSLPLFKSIQTKEVVIFGLAHSAVRKRIEDPQGIIILDSHKFWQGLESNIPVSPLRDFLIASLDKKHFVVSNEAHRHEHSIEAMLPFLQYYNPGIKITPIIVTGMDFGAMKTLSRILAGHIKKYIKKNKLEAGKDIFFLISADANHYGSHFENTVFGENREAHFRGTEFDKKLTRDYLSGPVNVEKLQGLTTKLWGKTYREYGDTVWCGKYCIPFGMLTVSAVLDKAVKGKRLEGRVLRYSDTYTDGVLPIKDPGIGITAPFSLKHWVGFFSAAYYLQ